MQNLIIRIAQENEKIIADPKIGCLILSDLTSDEKAEKIIQVIHKKNKLVLCESAEKFVKWHTDGFVLDLSKEQTPQKIVKLLRQRFAKAIIGVISRNRRHEAMLISECEPDFIIFKCWKDGLEQTAELLQWYSELFLIQCAAQIEEKLDYSSLLCDFVIIDDSMC